LEATAAATTAVAMLSANKVENIANLRTASLLEPICNTIIWQLFFLLVLLGPKASALLFLQEKCHFFANFYCNRRKTAKNGVVNEVQLWYTLTAKRLKITNLFLNPKQIYISRKQLPNEIFLPFLQTKLQSVTFCNFSVVAR
jgi:hypothetical protein